MKRAIAPATALEIARRVIRIERDALDEIAERLTADFARAVDLVLACDGRVVVTGMGKSGQICRKVAATLSSTGTSSFFLHAGEAVHGDLGMFARGDVCIAISCSGSTQEVLALLPAVKRIGLPLIAITGDTTSALARHADAVLDVRVTAEACALSQAPTASTTAALAMGDALAVAVLEAKGFTDRDFAMLHPGGTLGRKLMRVEELMHPRDRVPLIDDDSSVLDALRRITDGGLGTAGIVDSAGALVGVLTDGDIRRAVLRHGDLSPLAADDVMTRNPKTVNAEAMAEEALATMERYKITSLFILDADSRRPVGIIHLHDLLKAGVV